MRRAERAQVERAAARRIRARADHGERSTRARPLLILAGLLSNCASTNDGAPKCEISSTAVYRQRIEPLLKEGNAKSCNQCHLSGVDLASFVRATPCQTMACLTEMRLVNLGDPTQSKILSWILRAKPDNSLITEQVIRSEHDGFLEWIQASAACPSECENVACGTPGNLDVCERRPSPPLAAPAPVRFQCGSQALEQLFFDNVYAYRDRCFPCHFSSEKAAIASAPRWIHDDADCLAASLETFREVEHRGFMNLHDPSQSLILRKPLAEAAGGLPHGGDEKFEDQSDPAYRSFIGFIRQYAACSATP